MNGGRIQSPRGAGETGERAYITDRTRIVVMVVGMVLVISLMVMVRAGCTRSTTIVRVRRHPSMIATIDEAEDACSSRLHVWHVADWNERAQQKRQ